MSEQNWESYEEVASFLLNKFAEHFEVDRFEGKQKLSADLGEEWEIDGIGYSDTTGKQIIVECRKYQGKNSKIKKEHIAAIAFRITDTGSESGILVVPSTDVIQSGAKTLAENAKIDTIILDPKSTNTEYFMQFLNNFAIGLQDTITIKDEYVSFKITYDDGSTEERTI